ncbi:MAG: hypothetical protein OXE93_02750 [bacterium]|nr:hypothetical protein [bacterium]
MTGFELAQFIAIMLSLMGIVLHQQRSNWYQQRSIDQLRSDMNAGFAEARADRQAIRNEINQRFSNAQAALDKARTESRDGLDTLRSDTNQRFDEARKETNNCFAEIRNTMEVHRVETNRGFRQVWAALSKVAQRLIRIESRLKIGPPSEGSNQS